MVDGRVPPDAERRRQPSKPERGGRRSSDRIVDIYTHPEAHITVQAFAEHLHVQERTVWKWIRAGLLTAYQFPPRAQGEWRIRKSDAVIFVEKSRFRVGPPPLNPQQE